jgi:hypothetical protein
MNFLLGLYHHNINYNALLQANLFNNRPCPLYHLVIAFCVLLTVNCVLTSLYMLSTDEHEATHDTHGAIVPYSEPKLTIEQMVMKETFSR